MRADRARTQSQASCGRSRASSTASPHPPVRRSPIFRGIAIADETGSTFAENARQKALHYATAHRHDDDGRRFGIRRGCARTASRASTRRAYLREDATYAERFDEISSKRSDRALRQAARGQIVELGRALRLRARSSPRDGKVVFETTACRRRSTCATVPPAPNGFGYDPMFLLPALRKTFGEVSGRATRPRSATAVRRCARPDDSRSRLIRSARRADCILHRHGQRRDAARTGLTTLPLRDSRH